MFPSILDPIRIHICSDPTLGVMCSTSNAVTASRANKQVLPCYTAVMKATTCGDIKSMLRMNSAIRGLS
jgi:hypothetical protein